MISNQHITRLPTDIRKGLKKSEINSFINYARIREATAGNKNKSKIKELSKLINKDSLLKYGGE
jgi:hypothetical protein